MRTKIRFLALIAAMLLGITASATAYAQHGGFRHGGFHSGFGVFIGAPLYSPWYYPPPYYYPPAYYYPPVVVSTPPVYVEQQAAPPAAALAAPAPSQAQGDWYYCAASKAYYPYVAECPAGWQRVPAQQPAR